MAKTVLIAQDSRTFEAQPAKVHDVIAFLKTCTAEECEIVRREVWSLQVDTEWFRASDLVGIEGSYVYPCTMKHIESTLKGARNARVAAVLDLKSATGRTVEDLRDRIRRAERQRAEEAAAKKAEQERVKQEAAAKKRQEEIAKAKRLLASEGIKVES